LIPQRFVREARSALLELSLAGALEGATARSAALRRLSAEARGLGLGDLGGRLSAVAAALDRQSALGRAPNAPLAEALLSASDRVEALGAELARTALVKAFGGPEELP
jgi:hypothetical protein